MKQKPLLYLIVVTLCFFNQSIFAQPSSCTYQTYKWNVNLKKAVEIKTVKHSYRELKPYEFDSKTGCSVCSEDQVVIRLPGLKPFRACKYLANELEFKLLKLHQQGEAIFEVVGYRVGMTRGKVDNDFNRTEFSNHSFGIALDINPQQNGLYDHCIEFSNHCRLIRGGAWRPGYIGSLTRHSPVVRELSLIGLRWGGQILGYQKDFMHFSPTGY